MKSNVRTQFRWLVGCVVVLAICATMSYGIRHDFGNVDVRSVRFYDVSNHVMAGRIYRPVGADSEHKMPAVLNMPGYQNDKDVNDPFSIELARRGFVVLAMDPLGHGDSGGALDLGAFVTKPTDTAGWNSGYVYLKSLPFVDAANIGVMGHSLGAIASLKIALMNPDHKAVDFVAGYAGTPTLHNVLLTQARYDEFGIFREGQLRVEPLTTNETRKKAFGGTDPVEWNTTYGNFADGTARRAALINMEHHFLPLTNKAVAEAVDWMRLSLKGGNKDALWIEPTSQIFFWKEIFGLIALITAAFSMIPLTNLLLGTSFFAAVAQPMPTKGAATAGRWWLFATINAVIGGVLYPPLTAMAGLNDKLSGIFPFLKMPMGNALLLWFGVNAIVGAVLFWLWYRSAGKSARLTMADLGAAISRSALCRTILLGVILFAWMYVLEGISQWWLGEEFRFAWPFMRQFNAPRRFGYFLVYMVPTVAFFLVNGGLILFGQMRQPAGKTAGATQWTWWIKNVYAGLAGLVVVWAIQYLPWYLTSTSGPGFEEMGLPQYSALMPLMLQVWVPEFAILLFLLTWFYRRTGRIYLGGIMVSALAMWFLTAGTLIVK